MRGDHDLLRTTLQVFRSAFLAREDTCGLDHVVCTGTPPVDRSWVSLSESLDTVSIDFNVAIAGLHGARKSPVHGVVLEHVLRVVVADERVVDCHNLHVGIALSRTNHHAVDAAEAIDADANCHLRMSMLGIAGVTRHPM